MWDFAGTRAAADANVCGVGLYKGGGKKTLIQDEYNEGKELCKEIKIKKINKTREKEVLKAHVSVYTVGDGGR